MLKQDGFSLFEMMLSITFSSLIFIGITAFYSKLQSIILQQNLNTHLQRNIHQGIVSISKDLKRAGFIANKPEKMSQQPIEINPAKNCYIIRYDSEIRNDWVYNTTIPTKSDIFAYRLYNNNLEYKVGTINCEGVNWEKIFDPHDIKITQFSIKKQNNHFEIDISAQLKKNKKIKYQTTTIIKNENPF
ncbi:MULTISPECIES: prepilin peptidase-dependent protein [unclassified Gilliamella]|uniref:prepilin peptidase-dependent protein n=1 Tax=unclassified Gilliamella TaxID=2685620 RepID=UPI00226A75FD|nr:MULTISPECIES: prepilin peptidase-dependent protein [unclassified Gilliamella]MCX8583626.1 prepilin peptidase-dependent protein [Gilliamella sp. B3372]MCX8594758.1 prepilin peptidase-dependent protein [Gilliamella sp. B3367]